MNRTAELALIDIPDIDIPRVEPELSRERYLERIERVRMLADDHDVLVVYGDREHSANLRYLTGYDPRFEEALLIIDLRSAESSPLLLVGNEGLGYVEGSPIRDSIDVELYQSFSLLGQDRTNSRMLAEIISEAGIVVGAQVGVAGWKHFAHDELEDYRTALEIPSYIADVLRDLAGSYNQVRNANQLFMDSQNGLRARNEVDQLGYLEYAGAHASRSVKNVILGVEPGMDEHEAATLMQLNGIPLSCHPMLSAGKRAWLGMGSPASRRIERGEAFTTAVGVWGGLTSRAGFLVESERELAVRDYVDRLVVPYFEAIASWYELIGIGVTGGELYDTVHRRIGDPFFGVSLNPGHQIHLDEWVNSPIYRGSEETIESGMALQVDVIPATGGEYFTTNIEDGIIIADESTREEFSQKFPDAWNRIETRRTYMREVLGINLKPEVLPTSSIPAWLTPYILDRSRGMAIVGR